MLWSVISDDHKSKGGRPRKSAAERKVHRLSVAMSDAEQAYAARLAELLGTSVSSAIAASVGVHLRTVLLEQYVERCVKALTASAIETAREHADGKVSLRDELIILQLPNSPQAYAQHTTVQQAYDDAIRRQAEGLAMQAATLETLEQPTPYDGPQRMSVYFTWDLSRLQLAQAYQSVLYAGGPRVVAPAAELLTYNQPWDVRTERTQDDNES